MLGQGARALRSPCSRARARTSGLALTRCAAQEATALKDGTLGASLVHVATGASFDFRLVALRNGAVRLRVTEPGKGRYSPPDVLLPEAEAAVVPWAVKQVDKKTLLLTPPTGDVTFRLVGSPLRLDMVRAPRGTALPGARRRGGRAEAFRANARRGAPRSWRTANRCSA